ncbi:MAG: membrane integrity-associated transporter subunit PqiC [Deltaproteobacteria bacterium]|nr:membrane integrity-associated transporter subunit PqiC [Deltaproteobacteria bacterium]
MKITRTHYVTVWAIVSTILMVGCVNLGVGTKNVTRFYVLSPVASVDPHLRLLDESGDIAIGIDPVALPPILKRNQIISRVSDHEVKIAQFERWAEPLKDNIGRVLSENIAILTGVKQTIVFPWGRAAQPTYRLSVNVVRFDATLSGDATLSVHWGIKVGSEASETVKKRSDFSTPIENTDVDAMVTAMSRLLGDLSKEMAVALQALHKAL